MTTMICFRAVGTAYCLPVDGARGVRVAAGLISLPAAASDVAGIIPGDPPLPVISPLGAGSGRGAHILVLDDAGRTFGLLVDTVSGLRKVDDAKIQASPEGQERKLVSGTIDLDGELVLVTSPSALAERL